MVKQSIKFIVAGILATLFVTGATTGHAQNYPVQAFATLTPPYSLKLSDYAAPEGNRMRITLLLKDAQQPTLDVRLKLTIEGNGVKLTTNPSFQPTPITLLSSTLYEVSYDELSDYFLPQNLIADGISMGALTSSGMLPEGLYRFKVEAMEAHRDVPVSNTAMAIGWLMLNDPPQWISPRQGQKLTAGEPQGIQFLWTRCGMSSPNAALSTQYEVTMVEMVQQGMDPNVAIVTLPPIYQEVSPIENLFYGPDKPELIPGHSYAVRIRAFDTRGIDLYRNGGYSPVVTFRYGDPCIAPVFLSSDNISEQTADLSWNSTPLATNYRVRFRENGTDLSDWYEEPTTQTSYTVKNLKPDCTYEYQVQSECGSLPSDYSVSGTLRTRKLENQNQTCSQQLDNASMPTNRDPLSALHTNQTFLAGVMPVKVTSVQGSNGIFTGTGVVYLPIAGVGLSCTFNKVGINTNYQLISGEVITTRSKNTAIYGSGGVTVLDTLHLDNPIDTIIVNPNGDVAVVSGGDTTFIPLANQPVVIYPPTEGGDGTTTGNNTGNGGGDGAGGGGSTGGGGTTSYGDGPLIVENGTVKPYNPAGDLPTALFHKASMSTYGYDSLAYEALRSYYPVATINGKEVGIPYKALPVSGSDNVVLELKPGSSKLTTDSLTIDVQTNAKVMSRSVMGNNRLMVSLQGLSEGEEPIMVRYTKHDVDGKTEQVDIGAAKAVVYQPQPMKLVVVPLAGTTAPDAGALQSQLTAIYGQAVTSWTVTVTAPFGYTIPGGQLEFGSSEMASSYTEGMNNLIDAYKVANPSLEDGTYYLFVVPHFSDATLQGYMPRARRFGFIAQNSTDARTLAHELGHGAFNLEHTFPVLPQGTTDNLMDYNGGIRLIKPQWDLIHNPELTTGLLDDETDAASIYNTIYLDFKDVTNNISSYVGDKQYITYLTPAGLPITLPSDALVNFTGVFKDSKTNETTYPSIPDGALLSFSVNNQVYGAALGRSGDKLIFKGYNLKVNGQFTGEFYKEPITKSISAPMKVILGEDPGCELILYTANTTKTTAETGNTGKGEIPPYFDIEEKVQFKEISYGGSNCLGELGQKFYGEHIDDVTDDALKAKIFEVAKLIDKCGNNLYNDYKTFSGKANSNYWDEGIWKPEEQFEMFEKALLAYQEGKDKLEQQMVMYESDRDKFTYLAWMLVQGYNQSISIDTRYYILKVLADAPMYGNQFFGSGQEQLALRLVEGIKELDKKKELLTLLLKDNLINKLIYHIDGDEFSKFVFTISGFIYQVYPAPAVSELEQSTFTDPSGNLNNKIFLWKKKALSDYIIFHSQNSVDKPKFRITYEHRLDQGYDNLLTYLSPYEYIGLDVRSDIKYLGVNADEKNQSIIVIPAILFHWILNEQDNEKTWKMLRYGVDGFFITLSFGGYSAAETVVSRAFAIADLAFPSIDLLVNLSGMQDDSRYKDFVEVWDIVYNSYIGVTSARLVYQLMPSKVQNFVEFWKANRTKVGCPADKVGEVDNTVAEIERLWGIDDVINAFKKKFPSASNIFNELKNAEGKTCRAGTFWTAQGDNIVEKVSADGRFLIKYDKISGELLFADLKATDKPFLGYYIDEITDANGNLIGRYIQNGTDAEYNAVFDNLKLIHGFGPNSITVGGKTIPLVEGKVNIILGKYSLPSDLDYITTKQVFDKLTIMKYYESAENISAAERRVQMLNVPHNTSKGKDWWNYFNNPQMQDIINNPEKYNVIILANPKDQKIIDLGGYFIEEIKELEKKFNFIQKGNYWTIQ